MLAKRWKSGYAFGSGQLLRAALGKPWFGAVVKTQKHLLLTLGLMVLLLAALLTLPSSTTLLGVWGVAFGLILAQRIRRYGGMQDALIGMVVWHVNALALVRGFMLSQRDPQTIIAAEELSSD